jgi:hypothetical protein
VLDDIETHLSLLVLQDVDVLRRECKGHLRGHDEGTRLRWSPSCTAVRVHRRCCCYCCVWSRPPPPAAATATKLPPASTAGHSGRPHAASGGPVDGKGLLSD